ncbi:ABC transporter substrate-binding protein [Rubellicoccus peritrichatus]|uniref:ABC transporter substrate-binding protein n=1 Tax=Rubellicoccus peritrichatus TaxID=3080537 RepID=A0AAQ3LC08_9BACT|nr:ABC transporter substrate-binding protein [Puniceicoccus sp. CR14]WOO41784.1 ABC transporter substrate-binding protein [Puniceicoccus sp. CR14]
MCLFLLLNGCGPEVREDGRVEIDYWEKWTGFERQAMADLVDKFNASQDEIFVKFLSVSNIDRKLMLATAGGNPPDLAGIWSVNVPTYAENGALTPLDRFAEEYGITRDYYLPVLWDEITLHNRLWALPTTPGANALHWNKKLFREAGLDPDTPPRSIAELEEFNDKITRLDDSGNIEILGHLPKEPGWWIANWCYWFDGELWNKDDQITAQHPGNLAALEWVATYPERFGPDKLMAFQEMSGNFASPQNPFFRGRVAMVIQGPWLYNFINSFAPEDFEWGVAPFPTADPDDIGVSIVECDVVVIPKGAAHPDEAFKFIAWLQQQENIEQLNLGQQKFSPLAEVSDEFYEKHPNPNIMVYRKLAEHPNSVGRPRMPTYNDYNEDLVNAYDEVLRMNTTPKEALEDVQARQQKLFDRMYRRWQKVKDARMEEWDAQ